MQILSIRLHLSNKVSILLLGAWKWGRFVVPAFFVCHFVLILRHARLLNDIGGQGKGIPWRIGLKGIGISIHGSA